VILLSHLYNYS